MNAASPEPGERWDIRVSSCLESGLMSSTPAGGGVSLARLGACALRSNTPSLSNVLDRELLQQLLQESA